jgi:CheY-like chemotaxis protein
MRKIASPEVAHFPISSTFSPHFHGIFHSNRTAATAGKRGTPGQTLRRKGGKMGESGIKKILVVDDEETILVSLSYALQAEGVKVVTCTGIEQAIEALVADCFDLVIAEVRMLGANVAEGLELLTFIRQYYCTEVIVMTGYGLGEIEAKAYRRNALKYLNKPIYIKELLKACTQLGIPVKKHLVS